MIPHCLPIGAWVEVDHVSRMFVHLLTGTPERVLLSTAIDLRAGQVVGVAVRQEGRRETFTGNSNPNEPGDTYVYLEVARSTWLYLIRFGMRNQPLMVLPEHLRPTDNHPERLPFVVRVPDRGRWGERELDTWQANHREA